MSCQYSVCVRDETSFQKEEKNKKKKKDEKWLNRRKSIYIYRLILVNIIFG